MAYAFIANGAIGNTTFYKYNLHYKGTGPLLESYFSVFADVDLGDFTDDYVGSDTLLGLGYNYNADNADDGGCCGEYGTPPPAAGSADPAFYAIRDRAHGQVAGVASYLRIAPEMGTIEVGHICYSPKLQQRRAATEAMYLMMRNVFALGYRRYEWKCDSLNGPSRRAAQRLGFRFEGVFRQAVVYKGRNRDSA